MISVNKILQYEQIIFGLILFTFHSLIWSIELGSIHFSVAIILFGIFLLWQPVWRTSTSINASKAGVSISFFLVFTYFYTFESLILFGLLLLGIFGSQILDQSRSRAFDLFSIAIITLEMCIGIIPKAFGSINIPILFSTSIETVLLVSIVIYFFTTKQITSDNKHRQIDILHGILTLSLISMVMLGSIVINLLYGVNYIEGLLLTVFFVTTLTLGISWFWNPAIGFSGLGVLWNRYSMSIGSPFENWINTLTTLIEEDYLTPQEFLQSACENLTENDWLNGISWPLSKGLIESGKTEGILIQFKVSELTTVDIYFNSDPGVALKQHTQLLIKMASQFHSAKKNQDLIRTQEHFETIHHTGARLTHDIKNILQSIKTSLGIIHLDENMAQNKPLMLLDQNLNQISERLESTLNQLKAPKLNTQLKFISLNKWLYQFSKVNQQQKIKIESQLDENPPIPTELLDSVLNNLLSNALKKPEVTEIKIQVKADKELIFISVCDDGLPLSNATVKNLFRKPVSSGEGMGIGLYQSAIMANAFNFNFELLSNEQGKVCFILIQYLNE